MAIERRITELAGPVGGKLHTARSRNDQVATDMALFTRAHAQAALEGIRELMRALVGAAERHLDWRMPGYTHLQRAQPVYLSHHLLAYVWMLARDLERFAAVEAATARLPLGAGALAGVNFDTDRGRVARDLGFAGRRRELDRRRLQPRLRARLPRRGVDLRHAPQPPRRRDRAVVELRVRLRRGLRRVGVGLVDHAAEEEPRRGRAAAREGAAHRRPLRRARRASCTRLPLTYNKDMQEDKEHLFDAVDTLELCLAAATGMIEGIAFDRERMAAAASDEFPAATDVADLLVRRGMPFRECHGVVAALVKRAVDSGRTLTELRPEELAEHSELLDDEYYRVLAGESWLESKDSEGGHVAAPRARAARARPRACSGRVPAAAGRGAARPPSTTGPCSRSRATSSAASSRTAARAA